MYFEIRKCITFPSFKIYYKDTVIKTVWNRHNDKHIDKWNRIHTLKINPCICEQLIFNKDVSNGENIISSTDGLEETAYQQKDEIGLLFYSIYENQLLECIKYLNIGLKP